MLTESLASGPSSPAVENKTIGQLLMEAAKECPDKVGLIAGVSDPANRRELTYAQMHDQAITAAHALLTKFEPGERVAVMAPNIPEWVLLEFGSAMAGLILVTVNPSYQPSEIAYVLQQSESAGIFVLPEFRGNQMMASVHQVASECPNLREIISFDEWGEFLQSGKGSENELPLVLPDHAAMIQYTSGTTGFPKGVLLHHRGMVNNASHFAKMMNVGEGAISVSMVPLFHTSGCVLSILGGVSNRNKQILLEAFDPGLVLEFVESYRVSSMGGVPTMMIAMLEHPTFSERDVSSLKVVTAGGSTVPAALVKRLESKFGVEFVNVFGQTECSPVASMTRPGDSVEYKATTIGGPMPNVENKIVDVETGEIVPVNTMGEFCTRGYHVMKEYFNMPDATAEAIDPDGWLHTGDLCSMDEHGYCRIEGRLKDMIIRGGENIHPKEIENVLFKHPSVGEVAVVGLADEQMGELVGAFIRPAPDQAVNKSELFAYLREHLSPQKTPSHWVVLDKFPLTGSGKIQKFELAKAWKKGGYEAL